MSKIPFEFWSDSADKPAPKKWNFEGVKIHFPIATFFTHPVSNRRTQKNTYPHVAEKRGDLKRILPGF
jgi:hypothetical protein